MTAAPTSPKSDPDLPSVAVERRARWGRRLAIASGFVFLISLVFPVTAGLSKNAADFPRWWGRLDVGIAFLLAILVLAVMGFANGKVNQRANDATYRAYRVLIHAVFLILVVFFLVGERVIWINCLTGLAWRFWLLMYALPAWFTALGQRGGSHPADDDP